MRDPKELPLSFPLVRTQGDDRWSTHQEVGLHQTVTLDFLASSTEKEVFIV